MYKVECIKCGRVEHYKNQEESIENGCGGCNGTINYKRINVQLCSRCYNPETLNEELGKQLPEGLRKKYEVKSANSSQQ